MTIVLLVLLALALTLAYANGANDVSKGIATLVGSGVSNFRAAVLWGSLWTVAGGLVAAFVTQGLVATFSGKGFLASPIESPSFPAAVAVGAIAWILFATRTGLPVSTTHAILGALAGAGIVAQGAGALHWELLGKKVAIPLALSPVLSLTLLTLAYPILRRLLRPFDRYCFCLEHRPAPGPARLAIGQGRLATAAAMTGLGTAALGTTNTGGTSHLRGGAAGDAPGSAAVRFGSGSQGSPMPESNIVVSAARGVRAAAFDAGAAALDAGVAALDAGASAIALAGSPIVVSSTGCEPSPQIAARIGAADGLHWLFSALASFARGLNDTPKVVALGILASGLLDLPPAATYVLVAAAMGAGSVIAGFRVTETLAKKVTPMTPLEGVSANFVTTLLVGCASWFALPVSTTHVSTGAIIGIGIHHGAGHVRWRTVGSMLIAWLVTLPTAALVGAAAYAILR